MIVEVVDRKSNGLDGESFFSFYRSEYRGAPNPETEADEYEQESGAWADGGFQGVMGQLACDGAGSSTLLSGHRTGVCLVRGKLVCKRINSVMGQETSGCWTPRAGRNRGWHLSR